MTFSSDNLSAYDCPCNCTFFLPTVPKDLMPSPFDDWKPNHQAPLKMHPFFMLVCISEFIINSSKRNIFLHDSLLCADSRPRGSSCFILCLNAQRQIGLSSSLLISMTIAKFRAKLHHTRTFLHKLLNQLSVPIKLIAINKIQYGVK